MIQSAGVEPKPPRLVAPHFINGPLQEPLSQPLSDEVGHQAELHQFNFVRLALLKLTSLQPKPCYVVRDYLNLIHVERDDGLQTPFRFKSPSEQEILLSANPTNRELFRRIWSLSWPMSSTK